MNGEQLYAEKINAIEREITTLKTAQTKSAATIVMATDTVNLNFTLRDVNTMASDKRAIITLTTDNGEDMISSCYLVGITPSNYNNRYCFIDRGQPSMSESVFEVYVYSANSDDWQTLEDGGTVNLSYTVQLIGSSAFTTSVEYKNIDGSV